VDRPEGKKFEFFRPTVKFYEKMAVIGIDQMVGRAGQAKRQFNPNLIDQL